MAKIVYVLDSDNENDHELIKAHKDALGMRLALWELLHNVWRNHIKYKNLSGDQLDAIEDIMRELVELLEENGVIID